MTVKICSLFLLLAFCLITSPLHADDVNTIDWKEGTWGNLSPYIGTYKYDEVLSDERVVKALKELMDDKQIANLKNYMSTRVSIGFEEDCLTLSGNADKTRSGFLAICLYKGTVHAGIHDDSKLTLYTKAEKFSYLPRAMLMWVYGEKNPQIFTMPDGVDIVSPQ